MGDISPLRMSREDAENCLDEIRIGTLNVKAKLLELYEGRGWESLGYPSWRECIQAELQIGKSQAYRLLDAAYVSQEISPIGENVNESQARELAKAPEGKRAETLAKAKESAGAKGRAQPTAKDIREAVENGSGTKPPQDAPQQEVAEPRTADRDGDDKNQQGELCGSGNYGDFGQSASERTCGVVLAESRQAFPYDRDFTFAQRHDGNCPRGGSHQPKVEAGDTYCAKCFEPLGETETYEAEKAYDVTALDEFCRWTIDQCDRIHREELAERLTFWANEARGTT